MPAAHSSPRLSVVIPTFNNLPVLRQSIDAWREHGGHDVEVVVIEDGCRDGTGAFLEEVEATEWGARQLRWMHQSDAHELRCTNAGFAAARGEFLMAWQDDMFLQVAWLVPELLQTLDTYRDIGMISLSRGLNCLPLDEPIDRWDQLIDWRRLQSTIGPAPWNWFRLQEVDAVIRPWVVRRACIERVGNLDEAFRPTEWDEADLAFRIRQAGWRIATSGYERLGAYEHLGSTTISRAPSAPYLARVLENGRLFHARWDCVIANEHARPRRTWPRPLTATRWAATFGRMTRFGFRRLAGEGA
jgi:glycosyltransferase involved in cell wall biosynthesis